MANKEVVIQKYGGSSVADVEKMKKVAEYIKGIVERGERVVVVVSAMGKMTDELVQLIEKAYGGPLPLDEGLQDEQNKLLVTGEEQSAPMLALALRGIGVAAVSLTSREIELQTDAAGRVKLVRGVGGIQSLLEQDKVVVVTGFQGIKETTKVVTTLGRGGSDVTEIALAAALGLKRCENYTDVDGIFAVDPRIVPKAKRFSRISYNQLIQLTGAGSGKLMDRAVILAQNLGVEIQVLRSPSLGNSDGGTLVCSGSTLETMELLRSQPGVAVQKLRLVKISNIPNKPGVASKIFGALSDINIIDIVQPPSGEKAEISLLSLPQDLPKILSRLYGIKESELVEGIAISDPLEVAGLTLVDPLMKEGPGYLGRVSEAISKAGINIEMLSSSGTTIQAVVKEEGLERATQALAEEFGLVV